MRSVTPLILPQLVPNAVGSPPGMRLVSPADLHIDEKYQRNLSERSIRLIRRIAEHWDWTAYKPPIVAEVDGALHILDGQHTAIGAVTHGGIPVIPVMVVDADSDALRASAFVRHNRDRISVTPTQLHNAMVAAGDEDAVTINQVCERAGAVILRYPPQMGKFRPGEILAVSTVSSLVNRRHAAGARRVIEVCVKAGAAPVSAHMMKAVECLLFSKEYTSEIDEEQISAVIAAKGEALEREAKRFAAERRVPFWRAYASVIFMNKRKARNG